MAKIIVPSMRLQQLTQELNAQIRMEYGRGDYAMIGTGQGAVLVGIDEGERNNALNALNVNMMAAPAPRPAIGYPQPRRIPAPQRRQLAGANWPH